MYISFKNLALPNGYKPDPRNPKNIFKDLAYVKNKMGGFETLEGVEYSDKGYYKELIFYDEILPLEVVVEYKGVPFLTKVVNIKNKDKYLVKKIKVIIGAGHSATKIYIDCGYHPHVNLDNKYCAPQIAMSGPFTSHKFEKLRSSLYRWNLINCYPDKVPPKEDFVLSPIFVDGG
jgi:hypothetical protein